MANQQSAPAARLTVVQTGEGRAGRLGPGVGVVFKIEGADTGAALSIVEHPFAVGALVRPHIHTREDEISIVLEGQIGFRSEDQEVVLGRGGYIVKPRNQVHAMWNAGSTPARMIEIISPAGFEQFFAELAPLAEGGAPDPEAMAELCGRYELDMQPESVPGLCSRFGLWFPGVE